MNQPSITETIDEDWKQSLKFALKKINDVNAFFDLSIKCSYPVFIPLDLANKIKKLGPTSSLWKQFIPQESEDSPFEGQEFLDPIGDQLHHKSSQIIHRYKNRALFLPIINCPVICRYCFRKNELDTKNFEGDLFSPDTESTLNYLHNHPEIEEIIFSGGDPFIMGDAKIEAYLNLFSTVPTLKFIRFHTRVPVTLPKRITERLINILKKFSKRYDISVAIHCNHIEEITANEERAIEKLKPSAQLLSQTVLLKGINDDAQTLSHLYKKFHELKIRPYYLHHPDKVKGGMSFYLEQHEGLEVYKKLRHLIPGWMLPQYVVDHPEGLGKRPIGSIF